MQVEASCPKLISQQEMQGLFWYPQRHGRQLHLVCSFVPLWPTEWLSYLGLSSRFSFKRVLVTQGFSYISLGVVLDKSPSISKKKFSIGRLTLSIFIEFDADKTLEESKLIQFFWERFKLWLK